MDLVVALAKDKRADLVFANDPDADRLAVAVRTSNGDYVQLTGNEVGCLLGHYLLDQGPAGSARLVVNTIVSSPMLGAIAAAHGASWEQTLTGFKWIANAALSAEARGVAFVFGYEEALGYSCGPMVRDKDGIGAALRMAELVRHLKPKRQSLADRLDALLVAHGLSHQVQWSVTLSGLEGKARIEAAMRALREAPLTAIGKSPVVSTDDHLQRTPRSDVLVFHSQDGARLIARPSGTEPKIKFYVELVGRAGSPQEVAPARAALAAQAEGIKQDLLARLKLA